EAVVGNSAPIHQARELPVTTAYIDHRSDIVVADEPGDHKHVGFSVLWHRPDSGAGPPMIVAINCGKRRSGAFDVKHGKFSIGCRAEINRSSSYGLIVEATKLIEPHPNWMQEELPQDRADICFWVDWTPARSTTVTRPMAIHKIGIGQQRAI